MVLEINDRIRVRKLQYFDGFTIHRKYDSIGSTFKFNFTFNPNNPEHKEFACVGHVHIAYLRDEGDLLMTGYILVEEFTDAPQEKMVSIQGYSLPGVLQDCEIPTGEPSSWFVTAKGYAKYVVNKIWPGTLQSDQLSLREIAQKMINPFNLQMSVDSSVAADMDKKFDETTAKETQSIKSYLCELAAQKNIVITDNPKGQVVFTRPRSGQKPIYHFDRSKGDIPGTTMKLTFNARQMHSHIRVVQQQDRDSELPANEFLLENPYIPLVFRPHVTVQSSGNADDTEQSARNVLSKELKGLRLVIETDVWRISNKLWEPGQIISVTNPYLYLYKKEEWFIEEVILTGDAEKKTASLVCVLPCVYDGTTPRYIWEGINLH